MLLFSGGFGSLASKSDQDMGAGGVELSNKIGTLFWTEEMPYPNNLVLQYGSNQIYDHYGTGVSNPYVRFTGKSNQSDAATLTRAFRHYWVASGRRPKTGKWIMGCRITRTLGSAAGNGPLVWIYGKRFVDSTPVYMPGASTSATMVYVEVVIDWEAMKVIIYYDSVEVVQYEINPDKDIREVFFGSLYEKALGGGNPLPSVTWNQRLEFADFYAAHDAPEDPNPTGRLGAIQIVYSRVGVGSAWGTALSSFEWATFGPTQKKSDPPQTFAAESISIPSGFEVIGIITETSGKRSDSSTPVSLEATINYDSEAVSKITIPLTSSVIKGNKAVPFTKGIPTAAKTSITFKAVS